jgi:hypothetical protein
LTFVTKSNQMKKLKLKALEMGAADLLKREQLKNVLGGSGSVPPDGSGYANHYYCTGGSWGAQGDLTPPWPIDMCRMHIPDTLCASYGGQGYCVWLVNP